MDLIVPPTALNRRRYQNRPHTGSCLRPIPRWPRDSDPCAVVVGPWRRTTQYVDERRRCLYLFIHNDVRHFVGYDPRRLAERTLLDGPVRQKGPSFLTNHSCPHRGEGLPIEHDLSAGSYDSASTLRSLRPNRPPNPGHARSTVDVIDTVPPHRLSWRAPR